MSEGTVLTLVTFLPHEVRANLQVVAEIALVAIATLPHRLELVARLNLTLIVWMHAVVRQSALAMDEPLADSVSGELIVVGRC